MASSTVQRANELLELRRELTRLRYAAEPKAERRRRERANREIAKAHTDAQMLCTWALAGLSIARANAPLSSRRWARAVALLRLAKLCPAKGYARVNAASPEVALSRLATAAQTARKEPEQLLRYTPAGRRLRTLRSADSG